MLDTFEREGRVRWGICRFGVPELVLSRNRPSSSPGPGQNASAHAGRGGRSRPREATPTLRRPASFGQPESPRLASPRPSPESLSFSPAASVRQVRRPSAHPAASPTTRGWARPAPPRQRWRSSRTNAVRACATSLPAAPARPSPQSASARARCRASGPARSGLLGTRPPTVRLRVRVRVRVRRRTPSGRVTLGGWGKGQKSWRTLCSPGGGGSRENVPEPWLLLPWRGAGSARAGGLEVATAHACHQLGCHSQAPPSPLADDLQVFMGTLTQMDYHVRVWLHDFSLFSVRKHRPRRE